MRLQYIFLFLGLAIFTSCNNNSSKNAAETPAAPPAPQAAVTSKLGDAGTNKLMAMMNDYYSLRDALIATKADKANAAAVTMQASVDSFSKGVDKTDAALYSKISLDIDTIKTELTKIISANSQKPNEIRMHFAKISNPLFALCKESGLKNVFVYKQHCPMAFDDTGADWLSNYAEIKNPYFGDKMLECGETDDSLK